MTHLYIEENKARFPKPVTGKRTLAPLFRFRGFVLGHGPPATRESKLYIRYLPRSWDPMGLTLPLSSRLYPLTVGFTMEGSSSQIRLLTIICLR